MVNDEKPNDLDKLYDVNHYNMENSFSLGLITERDKFHTAKQILLGVSILYVINILAFLIKPTEGTVLLEISRTVFPPIATLILAFYFRDKA